MKENFPSSEKLKSKTLIDRLFAEGKSIKKFPVMLIYLPLKAGEKSSVQTGVSVPKRSFKRAVDRNYLKRLMREAYRKNKYLVQSNLAHNYAFMFIYTSKEISSYDKVAEGISEIFKKLIEREDAL